MIMKMGAKVDRQNMRAGFYLANSYKKKYIF